jgi:deoxyadenosine/deoxycytidine kinase
VYIVEGNVGAGKSTFLRLVAQYLTGIEVVVEPVASWQQPINGESILANFFNDTSRFAYTFETLTMMCRVRDHLAEQKKSPIRILERSIYSGNYCFAQNCFQQRFMNPLEWELYNQWFNFLIPTKCKPPHGFIYLRVDPKVSFKRIQRRARLEETSISLTYLEQLHDRHESFLIHKQDVLEELKSVPLLILDCNQEFEHDAKILQQHFDHLVSFIAQTAPDHHQGKQNIAMAEHYYERFI